VRCGAGRPRNDGLSRHGYRPTCSNMVSPGEMCHKPLFVAVIINRWGVVNKVDGGGHLLGTPALGLSEHQP
jgi:hypothetical protein